MGSMIAACPPLKIVVRIKWYTLGAHALLMIKDLGITNCGPYLSWVKSL